MLNLIITISSVLDDILSNVYLSSRRVFFSSSLSFCRDQTRHFLLPDWKTREGGSDINLISPSSFDATMITSITNVAYQHTQKMFVEPTNSRITSGEQIRLQSMTEIVCMNDDDLL